MQKLIILLSVLGFLVSCSELPPKPYEPSSGHINAKQNVPQDNIPDLVKQAPVLPEPAPPVELEKYTVVVNEVPVKEILFALARDAKINVDIGSDIEGVVTLNAVDQTLPQILDRIARQVSIRYEFKDGNLIVEADKPFFRSYAVNYLNMARDTKTEVKIATQLESTGGGAVGGTGGGGENNSKAEVTSVASNHFWNNLVKDILAILGESSTGSSSASGITVTNTVIPHPETGVLTVKATSKQHELIQTFIDNALASAHRQVLIQATIVEVSLNDQYSAGVDWSVLGDAGSAGVDVISSTFLGFPANLTPAAPAAGPPAFLLNYTNGENSNRVINATINLLERFGNIKVLSSPQIVAMNNQSALLKVVNNVVYFTIKQESNTTQGVVTNTFESTVHTVPVGIVMSLTPQINENDSVILNVRPTISRISDFVNDPNPALTVESQIPEIQVSEMESVLRINHGQVAVLGGLMQDNTTKTDRSIPGLSKIPLLGEAFKSRDRDNQKTELVIFLRPTVIRNPSLDGDLELYKPYLKKAGSS